VLSKSARSFRRVAPAMLLECVSLGVDKSAIVGVALPVRKATPRGAWLYTVTGKRSSVTRCPGPHSLSSEQPPRWEGRPGSP
jgi:hypothetical protein